mgnify:CR=1 FL=1
MKKKSENYFILNGFGYFSVLVTLVLIYLKIQNDFNIGWPVIILAGAVASFFFRKANEQKYK